MKKFKSLLSEPWFAYTFAACSAVLLYLVLSRFHVVSNVFASAWKLISPIVIGAVVAYLMSPITSFFEKKLLSKIKKEETRHLLSAILTAVCLVLLIVLLLVALIPSLVESITKLVNDWPSYTQKMDALLPKVVDLAGRLNINLDLTSVSGIIDDAMEKLADFLKTNVDGILKTVGSVGSGILNFLVGLLFGFCFMVAKKTILGFLSRIFRLLVREADINRRKMLLKRCSHIFFRYVGYTLIDALIVGVSTLVFLLIMRMPYAPLIAAVVAVTNIIPTFGPIIGGTIGIFFLILDNPWNALWFLIFVCALQMLDGAVIKPRLFSGSLGIPGVWVMILIILGGKLAGVLGILLAIPAAAIFVIIYNETLVPQMDRLTEKRNQPKQ